MPADCELLGSRHALVPGPASPSHQSHLKVGARYEFVERKQEQVERARCMPDPQAVLMLSKGGLPSALPELADFGVASSSFSQNCLSVGRAAGHPTEFQRVFRPVTIR